jgi:WD40 repeat protein
MRSFLLLAAIIAALQCVAQIETVVQRDGAGGCKSLAVSPDGLLLARIGAGISSSEIEIWNVKTGHLLRVIQTAKKGSALGNILTEVRFWKGSKSIITANSAGIHYVYDIGTGAEIKKLPITSYIGGVFAVNDKMGLFACLHPLSLGENQLMFFDLYTNTAYDSLALTIGRISALEFSPDGKQLAIGTKDGGFHIIDMKTQNRTKRVDDAHAGEIDYMQWTKDNYLLVSDNKKFTFWNLNKNVLVNRDSLSDGSKIVTSPTEDCFFKSDHDGLKRLAANLKLQRYFGVEPDIIANVAFDKDKSRMYVQTRNFVKAWDMKNLVEIQSIPVSTYFGNQSNNSSPAKMLFAPLLKSGVYGSGGKLMIRGIDSSIHKSWEVTNLQSYNLVGNTLVALAGSKLITWQNEQRKETEVEEGSELLFSYDEGEKIFAALSKDSIVYVVNTSDNSKKTLKLGGSISTGAISITKKQFIVGGQRVYLVDTKTLKSTELYDPSKEDFVSEYGGARIAMKTWAAAKQIVISPDETKMAVLDIYGQVKCWNLLTKKIDTVINNSVDYIAYSPDKKLVLATRNHLIWLDAVTYKQFGNVVFLKKGDYVVTVPGNYYKTSRNGAKAVAFRSGMNTASFDQFDAAFNRPDIVTKAFGNPAPEMLEMLQKAVAKRMKRLGNYSTKISADIEAPEANILNYSSLPTITQKRLLPLELSLSDKKNLLATFNGFVNGVPLQSRKGYDLLAAGKGTEYKEIEFNTTIPLDPGRNFIELSCTNKSGVESPRTSFEIYYEDDSKEKPVLHFIGIAAGKYKDSSYNLKYPLKDVNDVAQAFRGNQNLFSKVNITILKDEEVTKAGILQLKEKLQLNNTKDYVIIYWSGHGIVSNELDYYLATYNINFSNPSAEGMPYSLVEYLLDSIPARKRLLLLDACHSGEIDKDDAKLTTAANNDGTVTTYQRKGISINKKKVVTSAGLFADLFSDIRRNSGANIISAAGAAEYALEGDKWANGVFTYSFLLGLKEGKADMNGDGEITIRELQTYLQQKVPELTNGMQRPTSRTENLVNDWRIW